jgi:hypothetical protein
MARFAVSAAKSVYAPHASQAEIIILLDSAKTALPLHRQNRDRANKEAKKSSFSKRKRLRTKAQSATTTPSRT